MIAQCSVAITSAEEFKYGRKLWDEDKILQLCNDTVQEELNKDYKNTNDLTGQLTIEFTTFLYLLLIFCEAIFSLRL